ncbi:MAG: TetR/AcrR family transcriptional regulator [Chloroflexota bacterium]|nr:TetR/AcrR family transcriptional regulator [Chloroflexota bacterium]
MAIEKVQETSEDGPKTREERKIRILDAAWVVVNRDGFEGATTRTIAEEAGVNIAMLSYYFGSKETLLNELLDYTARNALVSVREALNQTGTVAEVLRNGFASLWGGIYRHPAMMPYNLVLRSNYDLVARRMSQALFLDYRATIVEYLSRTLALSGEEISVPLEQFAHFIVSSFNGIMMDYMIYQDVEKCEQQQQLLLQMLLTLVRP